MDTCSFEGCDKPAGYLGLCNGHNNQRRLGKELKPLQVQHHGFSEKKRFLMRVGPATSTSCKEWTGSKNSSFGHGQWRNEAGRIELTHRAAWRMFIGPIPDGMSVLHKCDNPACVNPKHLFLGSQSDNMHDMWGKGRANPKTRSGEKHAMSKLTEEAVLDIRGSQLSGVALAKLYGVSPTTICDVRKRRIWNHI